MQFSLNWLKEWVDIEFDRKELAAKLAVAGFEMEKLTGVCENFSGVVAATVADAEIIQEYPTLVHYKLKIKNDQLVNVVSKFSDINIGTNVVFAINGTNIKKSIVEQREKFNILTDGIICTAEDLGISNNSDELITLDNSVSIGCDVYQELDLDDQVLEIDVTPNRGDCLSIKGMTRELSAVLNQSLHIPNILSKPVQHHNEIYNANVAVVDVCPNFNTRIVYDVNNNVKLPMQIRERLRRSGAKSINPIVDIVNYTMIELGQPMHAYDLEKISGDIQVRYADKKEKLILIDGSEVELEQDTLVIADNAGAIGIAGVMGGKFTSVINSTSSIVLESAYFESNKIIGKARRYGLSSDSSFRFERGVCPLLQTEALDRASFLIASLCGGRVGPIHEVSNIEYLPQPKLIKFRHSRCQQILGIDISSAIIRDIFIRLGFTVMENNGDLDIRVPSYRFDINLEIDLIEEVARIYGYDKIITKPSPVLSRRSKVDFKYSMKSIVRNSMKSYGYNEAITYSFVDPNLQIKLFKDIPALNLLNPISPELSQMRLSILPGLLQALIHNQNRQVTRVKLFELGQCFIIDQETKLKHVNKFASIVFGNVFEEQWGLAARKFDFFDLKKDLENVLSRFDYLDQFLFKPISKDFLHPGQSCEVIYQQDDIGYIGMLHPQISLELGIKEEVFVFELLTDKLPQISTEKYKNMSIYPELRRDISFFINKDVLVHELINEIKQLPCLFLKKVSIFDIYEDPKRHAEKSVALGLILRDNQRTLVDEDVDAYLEQVIARLEKEFNIELRDDKL